MPVVISRHVGEGDAGFLELAISPLDRGFGGKTENIAGQHDEIRLLLLGELQSPGETFIRCQRFAGLKMGVALVSSGHAPTVLAIRFAPRVPACFSSVIYVSDIARKIK